MLLSAGEVVLHTFYHHYMPFLYRVVKVILSTIPFYFVIYLFKNYMSMGQIIAMHLIVATIFLGVMTYVTLVYWLDRLIVTNRRLIFIDWKYLTIKSEYEAELKDVQEIISTEKGIFSILPIFDYGTIKIKTASNKTAITFEEAPYPNNIKKFIQQIIIHISSHNDRRPKRSN